MSKQSLLGNPRIGDWMFFDTHRQRVVLLCGKVELGQQILIALRQIAADGLGLPLEQIEIAAAETGKSADERFTAGSLSIEHSGGAVFAAAATALKLLRIEAARHFHVAEDVPFYKQGQFFVEGQDQCISLFELSAGLDLGHNVDVSASGMRVGANIGKRIANPDIERIVAGEPVFIQDLRFPNILHARMLRPRCFGAGLVSCDKDALLAIDGISHLVRKDRFVAIAGADEHRLVAAQNKAASQLVWETVCTKGFEGSVTEWLPHCTAISTTSEIGTRLKSAPAKAQMSATFSRAMIAHGSIAPSCAIARSVNGILEIWTHSQGIYPLQSAISRALSLPVDDIIIRHVPSAGCYGHNGADDVALDAAVIAMEFNGTPVRVLWSREHDMATAPVGPPMVVKIGTALDTAGQISQWTHEIWSGSHGVRPGMAGAVNLLAAAEIDPFATAAEIADVPAAAGGGAGRNAEIPYFTSTQDTSIHIVQNLPARTSALRSLGAHLNVFAIESVIDDLARQNGLAPVSFRLANIEDPRGLAVIRKVAEMSGIDNLQSDGSPAKGLGYSRYKNRGAYAAVVAEIELDLEIRVKKVWAAVDAGLLVNPDGALNQLEGGIIQAISWTLKEELLFSSDGISTRSWGDYPILAFSEVPELEIQFVGVDGGNPPFGVGECMHGPIAAAVGNALYAASGVRVYDLPIARDRILAAANA